MTFLDAQTALLAHLRLQRYSPASVHLYADQLRQFGRWLAAQKLLDLRGVTRAHLQAYQADVRTQGALSRETQALRLRAVKRLFEYLADQAVLLVNPAEGIQEISRRQKLPRPVLTQSEVQRLLAAPNLSLSLGIRDRALLEILYSTGLRVGELERVTVHHVDLATQTLQVRHAKGGRPRVVPLGATAGRWLKEYLAQVRPRLCRKVPFERALFVVTGGRPLNQTQARVLLRQYGQQAKIKKAVTPHGLRHACATHLLQAGADIRAIQQLLGHVRLDSTMLYTRVAPTEVKATHTKYHPLGDGHASG